MPTLATECTFGKYYVGGTGGKNFNGQCTNCAAGKYQPSNTNKLGVESCLDCAAGKFGGSAGLRICTDCAIGTVATTDGLTSCTSCEPGTFAIEGSSVCSNCQPGTYQDLSTQGDCKLCDAGKFAAGEAEVGCALCIKTEYQDAVGQPECIRCPGGRVANQDGADNLDLCISPATNFYSGIAFSIILLPLSVIYILSGRYRRLAFVREERVTKRLIRNSKRIISYISDYIVRAEAERFRTFNYRILKAWSFLIIGFFVLIFSTIMIFVGTMSSIFFKAMIMWRGLKLSFPFANVIDDAIQQLSKILQVPIFKVLFTPFTYMFKFFATLKIDLAAVNVTCEGSSAPLELFFNIMIVGIVIIVVDSNIQLFQSITFTSVTEKFLEAVSQPAYRKWYIRECGQRLNGTYWGSISYVFTVFSVIMARALGSIEVFQNSLQYFMSVIVIAKFTEDDGLHPSSDACNEVTGFKDYDHWIALVASAEAWILFVPLVYEVGKVFFPVIPKGLNYWKRRYNKKLTKEMKGEKDKTEFQASYLHIMKYFTFISPDIWLAMLSGRWLDSIRKIAPYDTGDNALSIAMAQETAQNEMTSRKQRAIEAKTDSRKRASLSLGAGFWSQMRDSEVEDMLNENENGEEGGRKRKSVQNRIPFAEIFNDDNADDENMETERYQRQDSELDDDNESVRDSDLDTNDGHASDSNAVVVKNPLVEDLEATNNESDESQLSRLRMFIGGAKLDAGQRAGAGKVMKKGTQMHEMEVPVRQSFKVIATGSGTEEVTAFYTCNKMIHDTKIWEPVAFEGKGNWGLVKLDRYSGEVECCRLYNVEFNSGQEGDGARLADDLNSTTNTSIIILISNGSPGRKRQDWGLADAIYRFGGSKEKYGNDDVMGEYSAYALIGTCDAGNPNHPSKGYEVLKSNIYNIYKDQIVHIEFETVRNQDGYEVLECSSNDSHTASICCCDRDGYLLATFHERSQRENRLWFFSSQERLPSYITLCTMEYEQMKKETDKYLGKAHLGFLKYVTGIPCFLLCLLHVGHFATRVGRFSWFVILWNFFNFLTVCMGYWRNATVDSFMLHYLVRMVTLVWSQPRSIGHAQNRKIASETKTTATAASSTGAVSDAVKKVKRGTISMSTLYSNSTQYRRREKQKSQSSDKKAMTITNTQETTNPVNLPTGAGVEVVDEATEDYERASRSSQGTSQISPTIDKLKQSISPSVYVQDDDDEDFDCFESCIDLLGSGEESKELEKLDQVDLKRKLREDYALSLYALVATRATLLQLVPVLTPLSIFATTTSESPIFVFSDHLRQNLPELLITNPFAVSRQQEIQFIEETNHIRKNELNINDRSIPNPEYAQVNGKKKKVPRHIRTEIEKANEASREQLTRIINQVPREVNEWIVNTWGVILLVTQSRLIMFCVNSFRFIITVGILLSANSTEDLYFWMLAACIVLIPYSFVLGMQANVIVGRAMDIRDIDIIRALAILTPKSILERFGLLRFIEHSEHETGEGMTRETARSLGYEREEERDSRSSRYSSGSYGYDADDDVDNDRYSRDSSLSDPTSSKGSGWDFFGWFSKPKKTSGEDSPKHARMSTIYMEEDAELYSENPLNNPLHVDDEDNDMTNQWTSDLSSNTQDQTDSNDADPQDSTPPTVAKPTARKSTATARTSIPINMSSEAATDSSYRRQSTGASRVSMLSVDDIPDRLSVMIGEIGPGTDETMESTKPVETPVTTDAAEQNIEVAAGATDEALVDRAEDITASSGVVEEMESGTI